MDGPYTRTLAEYISASERRLAPGKQAEVIALCERLDATDDTSVLIEALQT